MSKFPFMSSKFHPSPLHSLNQILYQANAELRTKQKTNPFQLLPYTETFSLFSVGPTASELASVVPLLTSLASISDLRGPASATSTLTKLGRSVLVSVGPASTGSGSGSGSVETDLVAVGSSLLGTGPASFVTLGSSARSISVTESVAGISTITDGLVTGSSEIVLVLVDFVVLGLIVSGLAVLGLVVPGSKSTGEDGR